MRSIVTIDGPDGSGKSHFAAALGRAFASRGVSTATLHVDDFRREVDFDRTDDEAELYWRAYYAFDELSQSASRFADRAKVLSVPGFDGLHGRSIPGRELVIADDAVLVVEGVFVQRAAWPSDAIHVHLDADESVAHARLAARDTARGRSEAEISRRLRRRYVPGQRRYQEHYRPREGADFVIDNTDYLQPVCVRGPARPVPELVSAAIDDVLHAAFRTAPRAPHR